MFVVGENFYKVYVLHLPGNGSDKSYCPLLVTIPEKKIISRKIFFIIVFFFHVQTLYNTLSDILFLP